jgi:MFS family permease
VSCSLQGISAAIMPLCFGLVRERLPAERVPFGIGLIAGTAQLGAAAGYSLGGFIIDQFNWQTLFRVSAVIALIGLLVVWRGLKPMPADTPAAHGKSGDMDILGGVLFLPGIVGILVAITNARSWGWLDARTLGLLAASLLVLAAWVRHELRHPNPLLNVRLLMNKQIALSNVCFAFASLGIIQSQIILFPLLQQPEWTGVGLGLSATLTGGLKGGILLFGAVCSSWAGVLAGRHGGRYALIVGAIALTAAFTVLTFFHGSLGVVLAINVVYMFGTAFIYSSVANLVIEAAPAERASEASGMSAVVRAIFGALGAQAITYMLSTSTISNAAYGPGRYPDDQAFTIALAWVALTSAACLVCGLLLPRRKPTTQPSSLAPAH